MALTAPPAVGTVSMEGMCGGDLRLWTCGTGLPKAAATASQLGWMFSMARIVSMRRESFSGVQLISAWPLGILVEGWSGVGGEGVGVEVGGTVGRVEVG